MMLPRKLFALPLLAVCLSACTSGTPPTTDPQATVAIAPDFSPADQVMQKLVDEAQLAGAILMVAHRGEIAHFEAYGMMDLEAQKPMQKDTIFRIYSMTKPITSTAAMMLYEEGRLDLDAPVSQYIPALAELKVYSPDGSQQAEWVMTVRDLMRHTSGFTYGMFGDTPSDALFREINPLAAQDLPQMMEMLVGVPLVFEPGTGWNYGVSTDVLGRLVELQSGQSLDEFFRERIFEKLGMPDTGFWSVPSEKLDRFAALYSSEGEQLTLLDALAPSSFASPATLLSGGGGLVSTASDYMRFGLMVANGGELEGVRLLKPETVALMTTNQLPEELVPIVIGEPLAGTGFGLGFSVRVAASEDSAGAVGDYGWSGLASTHFWGSPQHDLVAITLEQTMPFSPLTQDAVKGTLYGAVEATKGDAATAH